jgi:hypothetical protein
MVERGHADQQIDLSDADELAKQLVRDEAIVDQTLAILGRGETIARIDRAIAWAGRPGPVERP